MQVLRYVACFSLAAMVSACSSGANNALVPTNGSYSGQLQSTASTASASSLQALRAPNASKAEPYVFVAVENNGNGPDEVLYAEYPYGGSVHKITNGISEPVALAANSKNELFVANQGNDTVTGYAAPGYKGKSVGSRLTLITSSRGIQCPKQLITDKNDNLFVLDSCTNSVYEFKPPYSKLYHTYKPNGGNTYPKGIAVDTEGKHLFFSDADNDVIYDLTIGSNSYKRITNTVSYPTDVEVDNSNRLYVADNYNSQITEYKSPYTNNPIDDYSVSVSQCCYSYGDDLLRVNSSGDIASLGIGGNAILLFPQGAGSPDLLTGGLQYTDDMRFDAKKELLVLEGTEPISIDIFTNPTNGSDDSTTVTLPSSGTPEALLTTES